MNIKTVRGVFSQFNKGLAVRVESSGASITHEVGESELADFALMLMDIADDCLRKLGDGYDDALESLNSTMALTRDGGAK